MLAPEGQYYNYSGCGNTFNCNHPVVRKFIVDCLRYWVVEMHVDGFRFDLASILTRAHSQWHKPSQSQTNSRNGNSNGNGLPSMEEDLDQGQTARCADHTAVVACNGCVMTMLGVHNALCKPSLEAVAYVDIL